MALTETGQGSGGCWDHSEGLKAAVWGKGFLTKADASPGLVITPADQGLEIRVILAKALGALVSPWEAQKVEQMWSHPLASTSARMLGFSGARPPGFLLCLLCTDPWS